MLLETAWAVTLHRSIGDGSGVPKGEPNAASSDGAALTATGLAAAPPSEGGDSAAGLVKEVATRAIGGSGASRASRAGLLESLAELARPDASHGPSLTSASRERRRDGSVAGAAACSTPRRCGEPATRAPHSSPPSPPRSG